MAIEKQRSSAIKRERDMLLEMLLKKAGLKYSELVDFTTNEWVATHTDLLSPAEKKQFQLLKLQ
ncbi:MAG: hypothetical protein LBR64_03760 [Dysgonamonadaceae bacterium]|jgi:hypothetical protein|nr:hypothetical protein [Dysgonamonadaceae bacterium]